MTFFALGLLGMIVWRGLLAQILVYALSEGAFASRRVIVIGERSRLSGSATISEIRRFGYTPIQTFEIGEEDFARGEISLKLRETIDEAIDAARSNSVAEILLLIGWDYSWRSIVLLPCSSYCRCRFICCLTRMFPVISVTARSNLGTLRAAEIQRAPLTAGEQFIKRCFDLAGATSVLLLLSPLMLLTALWIKLDSRGPILFMQTRNGFQWPCVSDREVPDHART